MKRTCLLSTAAILATLATSSVASADTKPAIIWVPTADVEATPSGTPDTVCAKTGLSGSAIAAGCLPSVDEATTLSAHARAQDISDGIAAAFAAYDLRVVNEPPPPYVPTYALFTGAEASKENNSHTCTTTVTNCAALSRDAAYFAFLGGTNQCMDPEFVSAGIFAAGLLAGLEGKEDAEADFMNYPPNFAMPGTEFTDACGPLAAPLGGEDGMTPQPSPCTSLDHTGCDQGQQNSHADLMENLGAATEDTTAPVITITSHADGDVVPEGTALDIVPTFEEESGFVAMRTTIASPALEGLEGITGGEITLCTTDLCDVNFLDGEPFKPVDSAWNRAFEGLPGGEYTITVEASDYYGNIADRVEITITLEGGPVDPTGGDTDTAGDGSGGESDSSDPSDTNDTFVSEGDDSSGGDTDGSGGGASDDGGSSSGCSVGTEGGAGGSIALMLGLFGLGFVRRRR